MFHDKGESRYIRDKQGKSSYACFHASRDAGNDEGNHCRSDEKYEYVSLLCLIRINNKVVLESFLKRFMKETYYKKPIITDFERQWVHNLLIIQFRAQTRFNNLSIISQSNSRFVLDIEIILANTYHLAHQPGTEILDKFNGVHNFMGWDRNILTDSGGFQMVSLIHLTTLTEEGVEFAYPHDQTRKLMMTPEESMRIQKSIDSDIVMQLDDVVSAGIGRGPRIEEAAERSVSC